MARRPGCLQLVHSLACRERQVVPSYRSVAGFVVDASAAHMCNRAANSCAHMCSRAAYSCEHMCSRAAYLCAHVCCTVFAVYAARDGLPVFMVFSVRTATVEVRCFIERLLPRGACQLVVVPGGQQSSSISGESSIGKPALRS